VFRAAYAFLLISAALSAKPGAGKASALKAKATVATKGIGFIGLLAFIS